MSGFTPQTVGKILDRDHMSCFRCGMTVAHLDRGWAWSVHHRRPRGVGGSKLPWVNMCSNGIILCGSGVTGCHGWVESHRSEAIEAGLLVPINGMDRPLNVPAMRFDGTLVWLTDDGRALPVGDGVIF